VPVLFVSYSGLLGGAERLLLDAAGAAGQTPTLACPEGPLAERARAAGLHVLSLRERPLELRGRRAGAARDLLGLRRELAAIVDALRPNLIYAWGMRAGLAAAGVNRRGAALAFQHNDLLPGPSIARAVRTAARRADAVTAASECIARELGVAGAQVIYPGVDLERFEPTSPPEGSPEVLVLGAIEPWKRPELALEAVALLPDVRLRLAGMPIGPAGEALLAQLRKRAECPDLAGRVEFAGPADAARSLARAHCLLHCADREPFGMVLAEALASARPVVAPSAFGPTEIVDDSCGRLYPPGDAEAAAKAIKEVLDRPDLGAAGRTRAERLFDVKETRRKYAELVSARVPTFETRGSGLTLVTVTHNSEAVLPALLKSASDHLPNARVLVVDSGSSDRSAQVARDAGATVIELGENVGFGRASNVGVAAVEDELTVLVNPDVELLDDSLAKLSPEPDQLLAPLVLTPKGARQDTAQAEPGSAAALAIALVPPAAMPRQLRHAACPWTANEARQVGWAVGCCVVARTDTLRRLGPFDEGIFMYGEDLDLGLRATDAGVTTWFRPDARVVHHGAHSSAQKFGGEPFDLLARQRRAVISKRRGAARVRADDLLQALTFADRIALKTLTRRSSERERAQLRALRDKR
jgi:GT2 family glycosyltransferase/glycosyltransferase involved in cell wall biosynthesis